MAQTKKAEENKQTNQTQNQDQPQALNTPPAPRQAGNNQPQHLNQGTQNQPQDLERRREQGRGRLARRERFGSPFSFMRRFGEEMDRLFEDFGFGGSLMTPSFGRGSLSPNFEREFDQLSGWSPQTEVFERGNELVVRADLPGMTKDDINVELEDDRIVIRGERRDERTEDEQGFYHTERSYGSFFRSIPLPQGVDGEQAKADFRNGVLEITMPKPEQTKRRGRRLEIGEAGNQPDSQTSDDKSKTANK